MASPRNSATPAGQIGASAAAAAGARVRRSPPPAIYSSIAALRDDADHAHYPWENAPSITVDGIVPGALAYYAAALSDSAAAMDVERAPNSERSCSLEAALENGDLQSLTLDVRAALYDGVRLLVGGVQEVHIFEVDLRRFTAVVDLTTQEKASLLCGDNADEVYSRCEVRVWPEQCAAAKTERRWQLRGMSSSRHLNTLRDVKGADRSPQVTGPISVFGTFSLWVQDFDAVYRTKQKADLMMSALLLRV
jgi:hypothetical protein